MHLTDNALRRGSRNNAIRRVAVAAALTPGRPIWHLKALP
jgi:hypothetical protein